MILAIGERMNLPTWRPKCWPHVRGHRYWETMRRLGAFREGPSRDKLRRLGLDLDSPGVCSVNLLPPDPQGVTWDARTARVVADSWAARLDDEFELVVLCGVKVAKAFSSAQEEHGREFGLGSQVGCLGVTIPHPSGLCRFWNDMTGVEALAERLGACLSRIATE